MKSIYYPKVGLRNVGSYQVSGHPYITGSCGLMSTNEESRIQFPYVSKSITVINSGSSGNGELRIHFNSSSAGNVHDGPAASANYPLMHHYITLSDVGDSVTLNTKCKEIYITSIGTQGFELFAELTGIPTGSMYDLTGSGLTTHDDD